MIFEIDVEKKRQLLLRESLLWCEKASPQRLRAGSSDRREHPGSAHRDEVRGFQSDDRREDARRPNSRRVQTWEVVRGLLETQAGRPVVYPARENDLAVAMLDLD